MNRGTLILLCEGGDEPAASALADAVLAGWPAPRPPAVRLQPLAGLASLNGQLDAADALWLYAGKNIARARLYEYLDELDDRRIPTLLTRAGESHAAGDAFRDGVLIGPADAEPDRLRLLLGSLLSQGRLIRDLKGEIALANRQQRGLAGQIGQLDEELRLASQTQRQFLPDKLPELAGVRCAVLFRPAGYVSGDIYDVRRLDQHHIGFYVADAVGHGVPAALLTMFIKQSLQTRETNSRSYRLVPPDEALARLNLDLLTRSAGSTQFATACYGTLHCVTGELKIARAGHPAPVLLQADGGSRLLEPEGPLLGIFEDEPFHLMTTRLEPGDRLLLYSDGFELAFGDEKSPFSQSYVPELHKLREGPLDAAIRRLERALDTQSGSLHQRDDLTALLIEMQHPPNP